VLPAVRGVPRLLGQAGVRGTRVLRVQPFSVAQDRSDLEKSKCPTLTRKKEDWGWPHLSPCEGDEANAPGGCFWVRKGRRVVGNSQHRWPRVPLCLTSLCPVEMTGLWAEESRGGHLPLLLALRSL